MCVSSHYSNTKLLDISRHPLVQLDEGFLTGAVGDLLAEFAEVEALSESAFGR